MIKVSLVWFVLVITPNGPQVAQVKESLKFDSQELCKEFAEKMQSRMEDFARGMVRADWDVDVPVRAHCHIEGTPA